MAEERIVSPGPLDEDRQFDLTLRPTSLDDFIGQTKLKEVLAIAIEAARGRGEPLDHVLLYGPPGLGKTTLAAIIARELDVKIDFTSGPVLQKKLDLTGALTAIELRQVFFIDEIHRLLPDVEEMLYTALEDFRVDVMIGAGPGARTHSIKIPGFTAIGATTRAGLISAPLRGRFGLTLRLNPYEAEELRGIVYRSARPARRRDRRRRRGRNRPPKPRNAPYRQPSVASRARLFPSALRRTHPSRNRPDGSRPP